MNSNMELPDWVKHLTRWAGKPQRLLNRLKRFSEIKDGRHVITPGHVDELLSYVFALQIISDLDSGRASNRFRSTFAFRGESKKERALHSKLERSKNFSGTLYDFEVKLARNFQKYARPSIAELKYSLDHLALAQHNRLATRMLDWTYSPFVALHFATVSSNNEEEDGVIYCLDLKEMKSQYPQVIQNVLNVMVSTVPTSESIDIALQVALQGLRDDDPIKLYKTFEAYVEKRRRDVGEDEPEAENLIRHLMEVAKISNSFPHWSLSWLTLFQAILPEMNVVEEKQKPFALFYEAPAIAPRFIAQASVFSLCSHLQAGDTSMLQEICQREGLIIHEVIIKSELKRPIRHMLDACNINERTLLSDVEGISNWLNRHYEEGGPLITPLDK